MAARSFSHGMSLLQALLLCGSMAACAAGADLPCPLSQEQMAVPEAGWVSFTVVNESCISLCSLNIAPTVCDDWGWDWLGSDSLSPGEKLTVFLPPGRFDMLVEDCTQMEFIWEKIDVGEGSSFEITSDEPDSTACKHSLTVTNLTDEAICYMWIAGPHSQSFGANWLGDDSIAPGTTRTFTVPEGTYDLKAETCDFGLLRVALGVAVSGDAAWQVPAP